MITVKDELEVMGNYSRVIIDDITSGNRIFIGTVKKCREQLPKSILDYGVYRILTTEEDVITIVAEDKNEI